MTIKVYDCEIESPYFAFTNSVDTHFKISGVIKLYADSDPVGIVLMIEMFDEGLTEWHKITDLLAPGDLRLAEKILVERYSFENDANNFR